MKPVRRGARSKFELMKSYAIYLFACAALCSCAQQEKPLFERLDSSRTGIRFNNEVLEQDSFNILQNEYMYNGGGVGVADLNNDGLPDIVLLGNKVPTRVFLNQGNLKFQDISGQFPGLDNDQWLSGVAVVDINADGWVDLYFTATNSPDSLRRKNQLWINQGLDDKGLPHFKEMAEQYGIADMGYSVHAAFFDYDLDGDLDLYVLNNIVGAAIPTNYRPKITDGSAINNDRLYMNLGDGTFRDVTLEAGIVYEGYGLGIAVGDINQDGYPDVYISNDYIANDLLYINQGDGTFRDEAARYLSYQSRFSMGNDLADINHDGYLDIITLDMMPEQYFRKKQTINGNSYTIYQYNEKYGYEPQYVRNMVQLHNGFLDGEMLPFSEVGQITGLYQTEWSWSALFADYDNDGDRDLLVTNGFPKDLTDKDFTNFKAQVHGFVAGDHDILPRIPVVKVSNYAFENAGDYRFIDRTREWGMHIPSFSNGAVFVDLDNDGDLDYVVNNINDEAFVYRNRAVEKGGDKARYLRLKLVGEGQNNMAIGAKIELWSDGRRQYHEHHLSRGYISSIDPTIHFGLGESERVDSIRVVWPLGNRASFLRDVPANQTLALREAEAVDYRYPTAAQAHERRLFFRQDNGLDFVHEQEDYVDFFQNQRIIQHKFSQIGPCMALGDLNGDGQDDLLVGGCYRSPTTVFFRQGEAFARGALPGLSGIKTCAEADLVIVDIDGDGRNDVVVVSGGYANEKMDDYQHYLYLNKGDAFEKTALPIPPFPASAVRPFDVDGDGDIDLFIGARVKRGEYPYAPPSFVLINQGGGRFTPLSFELGMVTDAVWSDYNGDGWVDLIVARDWNAAVILKNQQGKGFELVEHKDLAGMHGRWSCIVAGDFDNDGRDDYLLGNLGENHRFNLSQEYPLRLYAVDVDHNGDIDPIKTGYWKDPNGVMREYPVNYLDELFAQSPFFRKKFTSYTTFSYTPIDSILDLPAIAPETRFFINTSSSYILWNEGDGFRWERLPSVVQTAPVKKMLVRDFDGDGWLDALIGGNDYTHDVSTGYYDANKGILLLGREGRVFEAMPPAHSGLILQGQVGALIYVEGETPLLIAGINRDKPRVFKHQRPRQISVR
jgi:hypothetical protein